MRYFLICAAAFLLFALPAFAYEPPEDGIEDQVLICVDVECYMEFDLPDQLCFEIVYESCEGDGYDDALLDYYIQCNGDWYVLAYFVGDVEDPNGDSYDVENSNGVSYWQPWQECMELYINGILMTDEWQEIASGPMGTYDSDLSDTDDIYPWLAELYVCWVEKGNYTGNLYAELWDP